MSDHGYTHERGEAVATTGVTLTGFLVGAMIGAGLALLLAPARGSETRRKVGETARKLGSAATEAMNHAREDFAGRESDSFGAGGRREPIFGARTPQPGTPGASS
ncbi:MAG: hypothetical protein E6K75_08295 [Candidatus Eisenbacteria bacterium]|uniref:YtxH domain-containing protein n=1 Tax=Eiseniibacteriota bacterium TaxID=2212470 RepID=A0A538SE71_UNCEI|nr:MAG: hypothetical protein E6K71_04275 [Candidatus Eisenbacteria bacterium]TMQ56598.1 MAG: hypothetical protein E6K75_08295 [Candidatus Eisenbacteria bacterium]